jgi:hypothetical protein
MSLVENIKIQGYHRLRQMQENFINLRGSDLYELNRIYQARISQPYVVPTPGYLARPNTALAIGATATNDIRFQLTLPFTPVGLPIAQQKDWILDAPNYDQLQLTLAYSDVNSVFTGQTGATAVYTAFGLATGSPRVRVYARFVMMGAGRGIGYVPGRPWRYFQENLSGDIINGAIGSNQYNIPRGNRVRGILLKTGVKSTTTTTGQNAYNTLSNAIFVNLRVYQGINRQIRYWVDMYGLQSDVTYYYMVVPDVGYGLVDFAPDGSQSEVLNTSGLIAGPTGDTLLYFSADVTGAANQGSLFLIEELRGLARQVSATSTAAATTTTS